MNASDIAGTLRRQITSARFAEQERLPPERLLAEQFGVARGTVREALRQLEASGFVQRRAGSGTYVVWTDPAQIEAPVAGAGLLPIIETTRPIELIDARFALEPHMTRLAVLNATEADLAAAERHLEAMEGCKGDAEAFADADERFHLALADCARNPLLAWFMARVHDVRSHAQWGRMRTLTLKPEMIALYNDQHRAVLDAIRARDAEGSAAAMKAHLATARRSLVDVTG